MKKPETKFQFAQRWVLNIAGVVGFACLGVAEVQNVYTEGHFFTETLEPLVHTIRTIIDRNT